LTIKQLLESTDKFKDLSETSEKMRKLLEIDLEDDWTLLETEFTNKDSQETDKLKGDPIEIEL